MDVASLAREKGEKGELPFLVESIVVSIFLTSAAWGGESRTHTPIFSAGGRACPCGSGLCSLLGLLCLGAPIRALLVLSCSSLPTPLQADSQVDLVRQHFYEVSLEYVFKVQEVQERKMFEFVEPVSELSAHPSLHRPGGGVGSWGSPGSAGEQPHPTAPLTGSPSTLGAAEPPPLSPAASALTISLCFFPTSCWPFCRGCSPSTTTATSSPRTSAISKQS